MKLELIKVQEVLDFNDDESNAMSTDDLVWAWFWAYDSMLLDREYDSIEHFAEVVKETDGGIVENIIIDVNRMIDKGILGVIN